MSALRKEGDVNAHTHLYSGLAPLFPAAAHPPGGLLAILKAVWWRLDRALDEASLRAAARLYLAEARLAGTSTIVDHHESPSFIEGSLDVLAEAAVELGVRVVLCYGATERNGGREEARRGLAECARFIRENRRPGVRGMVGLHASFTVSDETIREAGALARELGTGVHVHLAEDRADLEDAQRRGHRGPLERLLALDGLPPKSILAHGVHLDAAQVEATRALDVWLVQNPRSNEANGVGYARHLWINRERLALGTDGFPSDLPAEAAALERLARAAGEPRDVACVPERSAGGSAIRARYLATDVQPGPEPLRVDLAEIRAAAAEQARRLQTRMEALT